MPDRSPADVEPDPSPAEIRARVDAYLASPSLSAAEREAALDYLAAHPEVAAARPARPAAEVAEVAASPDPGAVLATAAEVLAEVDATGYLYLPEPEVRLRGLAVRLAREVRRLLGKSG